jgi:hypothetical protein
MSATAAVATTRRTCSRTLLVSIVIALIVVVAAVLMLCRSVLRIAPRLPDPVIVAVRARSHSTVFVDSTRVIDDLAVRIDTAWIVDDLAVGVTASWIIHATALVVYVSPRIARIDRDLVSVNDPRVGRHSRGCRGAIRWSGLMTRRNSVDPDSAHPCRRTLTRRDAPVATTTTLRHRRRRDGESGYHCSKLDFSH